MTSTISDAAGVRPRRAGRALALFAVAAVVAGAAIAISVFSLSAPSGADGRASATSTAPLQPPTAEEIAEHPESLLVPMLTHIYSAFEETEEEAIYDALALAAEGEALEALYLQRRAAMLDDGLDGPSQSIHGVALLKASPRRMDDAVEVAARWRVIGSVEHQAHVHVRGNVYEADLMLGLTDGGWRLLGFELRDVDRTGAGEEIPALFEP